jgi:4-hydroxybenzoate polyprenyltransferase
MVALLHPMPVTLTIVAAVLFALVAERGVPPSITLLQIVLVVAASQIAIAVYNDVCDLELDRWTHPERPLPRGLLSSRSALIIVGFCSAAAVALAASNGPVSIVLVGLGTGAGLLYSAALKRTVWSWVPFAVAFPLLPVWVFVAIQRTLPALWTFLIIGIPVATAIHLADSLPDIEQDRAYGIRSLACCLGCRWTGWICWLSLALAVVEVVALSPLARTPTFALAGVCLCSLLLALAITRGPTRLFHRYLIALAALALSTGWIGAAQ